MNHVIKSSRQVIYILLIVLISLTAKSQEGEHMGPPPVPNEKQIEKMVDDLVTELNLSQDQENKVLKLYQAHFEDVKANHEDRSSNREEQHQKMEKLRTSFERDLKALLTDDQIEKFEEFQKNREEQRMNHQPPR